MKRKVAKKGRCLVDGKVTYRDEKSARRAMKNVQAILDPGVERVYYCEDAHGWHMTSTDEISGLYAERERGRHER